jgi:hypothetical protein
MFKKRVDSTDAPDVCHSTRVDGRYASPFWATYHQLRNLEPELGFDPQKTADLAGWRDQVRGKLRDLLCFPAGYTQPAYRCLWKQRRPGYELQKWEAYPEPYALSYCYLLIPDGVSEQSPAPAVLCAPGGNGSKELLAGEPELNGRPTTNRFPEQNRQAYHYVKAGYIALAVGGGNSGETSSEELPAPESRDELWNQTWLGCVGERNPVVYKYQMLQWLKTLPFVDPERLAVSAHSMSTTHVMMAAVLDPAVGAVVYNDYVCNWRKRQVATVLPSLGLAHLLPGMARYFDYADLIAAMAPRPFLVTEGGRTEDLRLIKEAYRLAGAESSFQLHYYPKYDSPEKRQYDGVPLPESMTIPQFLEYANIDAANHHFKPDLAIPWLNRVFDHGGRA